jgi:pimeloyl-ACP methyl ester carboxylesterase
MSRSILMPLTAFALLALTAIGAQANLPSVANSATPASIRLVGALGGVPDAVAGQFKIVVNDIGDRPINECLIVIDLSNCADLTICSDQSDPNALTNCAAKTVRKFTNALGEVTFTLLGSSNGAGHASSLAHGAMIFGNGVLIASPSVSSFDLDGSGGVGAGDLSVWLSDFGTGQPYERSDYDGDGQVSAADLSEWLAVFGAGGSTLSCGAICP